MFKNSKNSTLKHLDFLLCDIFSLIISFFLAFLFRFKGFDSFNTQIWGRLLLIMIFMDVIITLFLSPYSGIFRRNYYEEIARAIQLTAYNMLTTAVIFYLLRMGTIYSRLMFLYTYILYFIISVAVKYVWKKRESHVKHEFIPLFIISPTEKEAESAIQDIYASDYKLYKVIGIHLTGNENSKNITEIPVVNESYIDFIIDNAVKEVLVIDPYSGIDKQTGKQLLDEGITINYLTDRIFGMESDDIHLKRLGISRVVGASAFAFTPMQSFYLWVKQIMDFFVGLVGSLFVLLLMVLVKFAYLISGDSAPVIYRQNRVGKNGKIIRIFKFRSMVPNAEEILIELLKDEKYRIEWEENQKLEDDPRITKIGSVLRSTSLDELPQFFNVLLGDMSLIGPRPLVIGELEAHDGSKLYQMVKPGITGWWGCNGRSNIEYKERLELEYYYVKNVSFYLDFLCAVRTVVAIIKRNGAK